MQLILFEIFSNFPLFSLERIGKLRNINFDWFELIAGNFGDGNTLKVNVAERVGLVFEK